MACSDIRLSVRHVLSRDSKEFSMFISKGTIQFTETVTEMPRFLKTAV